MRAKQVVIAPCYRALGSTETMDKKLDIPQTYWQMIALNCAFFAPVACYRTGFGAGGSGPFFYVSATFFLGEAASHTFAKPILYQANGVSILWSF